MGSWKSILQKNIEAQKEADLRNQASTSETRRSAGIDVTATTRTRDRYSVQQGQQDITDAVSAAEVAKQEQIAAEQARMDAERAPYLKELTAAQNRYDKLVLMEEMEPAANATRERIEGYLKILNITPLDYWTKQNLKLQESLEAKEYRELMDKATGSGLDAVNAQATLEVHEALKQSLAATEAAKAFTAAHPEFFITRENGEKLAQFMQENQLNFADPNDYWEAAQALIYSGSIEVDAQTLETVGSAIHQQRIEQGYEAQPEGRGWQASTIASRLQTTADDPDEYVTDSLGRRRYLSSDEYAAKKGLRRPVLAPPVDKPKGWK